MQAQKFKIVSIIIASLSSAVIVGWVLDNAFLRELIPNAPSMKFNTAVAFLACAYIIYSYQKKTNALKVIPIAGFLIILGSLSLSQDILGINLGIDELVFKDVKETQLNRFAPGRLSPMTSFNFILIGISYYLLSLSRWSKVIGQYLLHLVTLTSFLSFIGFAFSISNIDRTEVLASMAINTSILFMITSVTMSLANPNLGVTGVYTGNQIGNSMFRYLAPRYTLVVLLLIYLCLITLRHNVFTVEFAIALLGLATILSGIFLLISTVSILNRIDLEREKSEDKLAQLNLVLEDTIAGQEQELSTIYKAENLIFFATDELGYFTKLNQGAKKLLGYSDEDLIQTKRIDFLCSLEEKHRLYDKLNFPLGTDLNVGEGLASVIDYVNSNHDGCALQKKDGSILKVQMLITPFSIEKRDKRGYIGLGVDVSEMSIIKLDLEKLVTQLQNQNKQLLNFAHVTSHNLRSPVNSLRTLLQFYHESEDPAEKEYLFGKFDTVIQRLTTTLEELVESLRIQEDPNGDIETLSFAEILAKTKEFLSAQIISTQAAITSNFELAPEVEYPRIYLDSIFLNLLSNALKYRSPDRAPVVHLESKMQNNRIVLTESDNGIGIDLKKYGDSVFGLNKTFHSNKDSKGLGLFIAKTQIEAMGGRISVESEVNKGTTFKITFAESA